MKKSYLAVVAILGAAVFAEEAHAVKIDLGGGKSFKMGFRGIIYAEQLGQRTDNDKADLMFIHKFARLYAKGKLNKMISFGFQTEFFANANKANKPYEIIDSFLNVKFADEVNMIAGSYKFPFERHSGINSGWAVLFPMPFEYSYEVGNTKYDSAFTNPSAHKPFRSGSRSPGLTFWGNVAGGMIKYYAGIFDVSDEGKNDDSAQSTLALRVQFTPTMAGFKPEKGYVLKDTYAGKKNVLTIGVAFASQGYNGANDGGKGEKPQTSIGVDLLWEQNLGGIVPNVSAGYVQHKNWAGTDGDDRTGFLVQGGVLLDNVNTPLGKPAFVLKYTQTKQKDGYTVTNFGAAVNLYVGGPANRVALGMNNVKVSDVTLAGGAKDSYTDFKLALFYNF